MHLTSRRARVAALWRAAHSSPGRGVRRGGSASAAERHEGNLGRIATPAKTNDYGWNAQGVAGLAGRRGRLRRPKVKVVQNIGYNNTPRGAAPARRRPTPGLIIAHASGYDTQAKQVAKQYKVPMITYDIPTCCRKGDAVEHHDLEPAGRLPRRDPRRQDDQDRQRSA